MRLIQCLILSLAVWTNAFVFAAQEHITPASDPIAASLAEGTISAKAAAVYRAVKILQPDSLPAQFRNSAASISKCPTDELVEAFNVILENPEEYQQYAKMYLVRPSTQWYIETPLGYFRLHFDTSGPNSIPLADNDSSGVPDYIERAANFADSSWLYEVVTLGHYPPVSDGSQGGSDQYDIYFQQVPYYGFTSPETAGPAAWNDFSSHIVVHNTFTGGFPTNDDPEGLVLGALKVTIAHEFYHAIQFAYDVSEESYFMEESSTWMEEMAYPQVNDNYNYLPFFYAAVQTGLQAGGSHRYGSFIWPKFLQERFGVEIMREIWSRCRSVSAPTAWGSALDSAGGTIEKEFIRFVNWNYHTGNRDAGAGFEAAADYPQVNIMDYHYTLPDSGNVSAQPPEPFASNYIVVENLNGYSGMLVFDFTGLSATTWGITYVVDYGGGVYADSIISPIQNGKVKISIPNIENALRVIFIPGVASHFGT
ncbi:MAG: MXAN_6640 family putative metalloprotease, partial [Candidatus Zixiibacteriota bacterium]